MTNGAKIKWQNQRIQINAPKTDTEPIIRIYSEAKTVEEAKTLSYKFITEIEKSIDRKSN